MDIILENSMLENAHVFMDFFIKDFDNAYMREICVDKDVIKP